MQKTKRNIVIGQRVAAAKAVQARRLRQQMTAEEKQLWQRLKGNRLGFHFRRQQVIDGFIVDFYCHAVGLVIEVDGEIHERQAESDAERDRIPNVPPLYPFRYTPPPPIPSPSLSRRLGTIFATIKN